MPSLNEPRKVYSRFILLPITMCCFCTFAGDDDKLETILNFHLMTDTIGTAGQPTKMQFEDVGNASFSVVVNLAMPDSPNALPDEGMVVSSLGITYIHIPVPWDAPSVSHVKEFFDVMDALEGNGERVFVHCAANYRASAFAYKYLTLRKGVSSEQATSPLLRRWLPEMDDNWRSIMELRIDEID